MRGAPWLAGEPRTSARAWQPRSPGPKEATQARVPCRHRPNVGAKAPIGGLQWVPTAPKPPRGRASPTASPGGRARSGEVGPHQRKAAHACADFCAVHARRWSCSPPPPLRPCSWPASAGALLVSIEPKIPERLGSTLWVWPVLPSRSEQRYAARDANSVAHCVIRAQTQATVHPHRAWWTRRRSHAPQSQGVTAPPMCLRWHYTAVDPATSPNPFSSFALRFSSRRHSMSHPPTAG